MHRRRYLSRSLVSLRVLKFAKWANFYSESNLQNKLIEIKLNSPSVAQIPRQI